MSAYLRIALFAAVTLVLIALWLTFTWLARQRSVMLAVDVAPGQVAQGSEADCGKRSKGRGLIACLPCWDYIALEDPESYALCMLWLGDPAETWG